MTVEEAIASLNLDTLAAYTATPEPADGDDTAYWAARIAQITGDPDDAAVAYPLLSARLDAILRARGVAANPTRYTNDVAPGNRPKGLGPEHNCATPTLCDDAPDWWEDHCHIYPILLAYKEGTGDRDLAYARLAAYYQPTVAGVTRRFRSQQDREEIVAFAVRALHACIDNYRLEKRIPLQAYIRAHLAGRIVDRLRSEGTFTRSEGAFANAVKELCPEHVLGDPLSEQEVEKVAERMRASAASVRAIHLGYLRKIRTLHIEHQTGSDDDVIQLRYSGEFDIERVHERSVAVEEAATGFQLLAGHLDADDRALLLAWHASEPGLPNPVLDGHLAERGIKKTTAAKRVRELLSSLARSAAHFSGPGSLDDVATFDISERIAV